MERPIIHLNLDEQGVIQQIHGDLRFYQPLTLRYKAPPITKLLALSKATLLIHEQFKWNVEVFPGPGDIQTFIRLRSVSEDTQIDLLVQPNADRFNPRADDIQVHIIFTDDPVKFDNILLDVYDQPDLQNCLTTFIAMKENFEFINDTAMIVEATNQLRRQKEHFIKQLTKTPFSEDSSPES